MKLIDVDKLKKDLLEEKQWLIKSQDGMYEAEGFSCDQVFFTLDMQEIVDAIPVVRCKDCKYRWNTFLFCTKHKTIVYPDFYCAKGELKDSEQDDSKKRR